MLTTGVEGGGGGGGLSSSEIATVAVAAVELTSYKTPSVTVTVTEPSTSSVLSPVVEIVSVAEPVVGIVTVREPVVTPKLPEAVTFTVTVAAADGAGEADNVNDAELPSVTAEPATMLTTGVEGGGGGGLSSSEIATVAVPDVESTS